MILSGIGFRRSCISEIIPNNLSNPEQFIQSLIGGDKVTEITAKLIEAIKHKFESGQLKEEDIKHDLERIQNIFEKSGQNSVVKGVIENMKKEKEFGSFLKGWWMQIGFM